MFGLVRSTRYANETASPRRQRHSREAGSCSGRLSVGKGISALRWLVVAPMCPAYLRGFAWPLALMPFARFRSLPIARTRSAVNRPGIAGGHLV